MIDECLAVEFRVAGDDCPLAEASRAAAADIDARPPQLRDDGYALLRFSAPTDEAVPAALDADDRIRYLHVSRSDGRHSFRCLSKHRCVVHELVSAGFLVEGLRYRDGVETHTGAVVGHEVLRGVIDTAGETVGVRLERIAPLGDEDAAAVAQWWDLTPRQEETLRVALEMGYFAIPRESTASEAADTLGISKSAFLERLRRGQAKLLSQHFDE